MNDTNPHLTPTEFDQLLNPARQQDNSFATSANAHLLGCEQCRRALRSRSPAVEERLVRLFTQEAESDWLASEAACVAQEDLSRYVADNLSAPKKAQVETHLKECRFCRRDVREMRELHQDAEALLQSLSALPVAEPQRAPVAAVSVPASSPSDLEAAAPAEAPPVAAPPADEKAGVWQRWREKWLPNRLLAPNSLFSLTAGAALAASVLILGFLLPLRQQLHTQQAQQAQDEAHALQLKEQANEAVAQLAGLQAEMEKTRQTQGQLTQQSQTQVAQLQKAKRELETARQLLKQNPLAGATLLPNATAGEQWFRDKQGRLTRVQQFDASLSKMLEHPEIALMEGRKQLVAIDSKQGVTLGNGHTPAETMTLLTPVACVVSSTTPQFQWRSLAGNLRYQVQIREENSAIELDASEELTKSEWTPPTPLHPGILYSWQVIVIKANGEKIPSASKMFKVLDEPTAMQIDKLAGSPYQRGLLYAKAGAFLEAEQEFKRVPQSNPHLPQAQALLKQVQALRQTSAK